MKRSRYLSTVALAATTVLLAAACSPADAAEGDDSLTIGFAVPAANQTYWTAYINAVEDRAAELGVNVTFADAQDDPNAQVSQVNNLVTAQVDGIVLVPVDPVGPAAVLPAVADADIPLITSNRVFDREYGGIGGAIPYFHTGFDDVALGRINGELVAQACEGIDPCNVVGLTANLGTSVQIQRQSGQEEIFAEHSNIHVLDTQPDNFDATAAAQITSNWLQRFADIDVLTCHFDEMCITAANTIAENGISDIQVVGIGGSRNGIAAIEDGRMYGTAWVSATRDGIFALESIVALIRGDDVATELVNGVPTVPVPAAAVTMENADEHPGEW